LIAPPRIIMKKIGLTIILVISLVALILAGCNKIFPDGTLSGDIYFIGTTIQISGVSVDVSGKESVSSSEGAYRIEDLSAGGHIVKAEKKGFDSYSSTITLSGGSDVLDISMSSSVYTGRIYGTINGEYTGDPKSGFTVVVLNPDSTESQLTSTSDAKGYFQILSVPLGERSLIVRTLEDIVFETQISIGESEYVLDIAIHEDIFLTDPRDGRTYKCVVIGSQVWMAENLNYKPMGGNSWCYDDVSSNCSGYGRLYDWNCTTGDGHGNGQDICPVGWHLPADYEWGVLELFLGMSRFDAGYLDWRHTGDVGKELKSKSDWNGTDIVGFNALPGGYRGSYGGFFGISSDAYFWSSSPDGSEWAWFRSLNHFYDGMRRYGNFRGGGFSVRCLKD